MYVAVNAKCAKWMPLLPGVMKYVVDNIIHHVNIKKI
jgi:hypothetical protein